VGAPRPAASPFLAHDHCARYGCERSPSRQAKTIHSPSAVVVEPTSRSGTQSDWKKDRVCAVRGERGQCTFCVFSMAPKNRIFLPDCC
jgi:5-methylcytosine-specific restriction endonuclease McrA